MNNEEGVFATVQTKSGIQILFEDDGVIVLNKPEGLPTIPDQLRKDHCLLAVLSKEVDYKPFVVHRLDKPVSGVIVFAKNRDVHRHLSIAFEKRLVHKTYTALVHGSPPAERATIDLPLRRFGSGRTGVDMKAGKPSRSEYEVKQRIGDFALVEVSPFTGRRHQIRVHLYAEGLPIVGDLRYGEREIQVAFPRLMLHASRLELQLPGSQPLNVSAPLPRSFMRVLNRVRAGEYNDRKSRPAEGEPSTLPETRAE
jgi:tRNA pseudouridine32 synthase / 23S rRNA pseudouridine746 synthase